ncbi:hypothetical protein J1N35_025838 [Gossypium stocksii]|uniref:Transposase MuDR plant domain-containing protein n=1 Tax=Gossypium stocksii TaxID=47602 RepID=A0A9D3V7M4_9ROSI|nr:hypothetical protein J1N35_025838 [Gossypium stocksii]
MSYEPELREKSGGPCWGRITMFQCIFLASIDPYKYELFDVIDKTHLEIVISSYISSRNVVIELYVKFTKANGSGPSSTSVVANTSTEVHAESPTTQLCGGFSSLLQSNYYNVPRTSIGRHSSVSGIDLNFEISSNRVEGGLELSQLSHRTPGHASTIHDVQVLEVGMEYPNKDAFLIALKWYSIRNENYYVMKSHSNKFKGKYTTKDGRCKWKIKAAY